MIEIKNVTKRFDNYPALSQLSLTIQSGIVYGLLGTNGAGKSTLLRMISGVIPPDEGEILLDGENTYDNPAAKRKMFFIADDAYFFSGSTGEEMARYYENMYPDFDRTEFSILMEQIMLDKDRKIATFSKGMRKQLSIILGICARTDYLLMDETFDGLDPVMRQAVKSLLAKEMQERGLTPVIASHNLRELEDICDTIGLLHKGGVLLSKDLDEVKCNLQKVQCVFADDAARDTFLQQCNVVKHETRGSVQLLTVRGTREEIAEKLANANITFGEVLPLTLEEIFISETEVVGYDIKKLILEA